MNYQQVLALDMVNISRFLMWKLSAFIDRSATATSVAVYFVPCPSVWDQSDHLFSSLILIKNISRFLIWKDSIFITQATNATRVTVFAPLPAGNNV